MYHLICARFSGLGSISEELKKRRWGMGGDSLHVHTIPIEQLSPLKLAGGMVSFQ